MVGTHGMLVLAMVLGVCGADAQRSERSVQPDNTGEGCWTWVGGSAVAMLPPGPAAITRPAGRCCSQSWTPTATPGYAYLFGGVGPVHGFSHTLDDAAYQDDLWELEIATNKWRMVGGSLLANRGSNSTSPAGRNYGVTWSQTNVRKVGACLSLC